MKIISKIITFIFIVLFVHTSYAWTITTTDNQYCSAWWCWLTNWVHLVEWGVSDMETDRGFSEYIQDIVVYVLSFVSLIAVIYLFYAGFIILTSAWDEEKLKKTKNIIIYVIVWIIIMWLARSILLWLLLILNPPTT